MSMLSFIPDFFTDWCGYFASKNKQKAMERFKLVDQAAMLVLQTQVRELRRQADAHRKANAELQLELEAAREVGKTDSPRSAPRAKALNPPLTSAEREISRLEGILKG